MYLESGQLCPVRSGVLSVSHRDHHQRDIKHLDNSVVLTQRTAILYII